MRNIPADTRVTGTAAVTPPAGTDACLLPRIVAVRTRLPRGTGTTQLAMPRAVFRELDPINLTAASLYRALVFAAAGGTRELDLDRDVFESLAWFHNWSGRREALDAVLAAAALLDQHGWLARRPTRNHVQRWTPLGRDRPRLPPMHIVARRGSALA